MHSLAALALALLLATASVPSVGWQTNVGGRIYSSPVLYDLDQNASLEILVCDSEGRQLVCLDSQGAILWRYGGPHLFRSRLTATPAVAPVDRDPQPDIFVAGSDGQLARLRPDGSEVWRIQLPGAVNWSGPSILSRPFPLILVGTEDRWLVAVQPHGAIAWQRRLHGAIGGHPCVADLDGDGAQEIISTAAAAGFYCLDHLGAFLWRVPAMAGTDGVPVVARLAPEQAPTIIIATGDGQVLALEAPTRRLLWRYRTVLHNTSIDNTLALADLDGDRALEIIFADTAGYLYALNAQGHERFVVPIPSGAVSAPAIGDVDGDGTVEILAPAEMGDLLCFSSDGRLEWRFAAPPRLTSSPAIADVDNDGETEIILASHNNSVYCLTLHAPFNPALAPWPAGRNNPAQTGSLD